jgi:hypothetical protein
LNKEFKKRNKTARDDSYNSLKTAEQKARANPQKFLAQVFPKGGTGRPANLDIVVLKIGVDDRFGLAKAAEVMRLETCSVDAPWTSNKKPSPDRWIIVGRTRDAVWNQMRDIEREAARSKQTFASEKAKSQAPKQTASKPAPKEKANAPAAIQRSPNPNSRPPTIVGNTGVPPRPGVRPTIGPMHQGPRTKQTARKSAFPERPSPNSRSPEVLSFGHMNQASPIGGTARKTASPEKPSPVKTESSSANIKASDSSWDVRGSYHIRCPEIEGQWSPQGMGDPSLTLDLCLETRHGKQQLYGMFHFRVVEGIMRFEKPIPVPKAEPTGEESKKRKREDMNDDPNLEMDALPEYKGIEGSSNYTAKVFFLGAKDKPTARRPTWRYRWRGSETGEGEIQLGSDKDFQSITFSKKGMELEGTIKINFAGTCHFTGVKVHSQPQDPHVDPEAQWNNNGEAAYESARKVRWGGRGGW